MLIGIACFTVFAVMALLMYLRRLSALLALPIMAIVIAIIGGIPIPDILNKVISAGSLKLHSAYTTTMFGAVLAELINRQGIAKTLIRWVAEYAGDNPFILGILLALVTALLFSTLGGLGAVIMVGTIVLPVMLSLGIGNVTAGGLFLFGISIGGMFNLANWQLYIDILNIRQADIISFVLPFMAILVALMLVFLGVELRKKQNLGYLAIGICLLASILAWSHTHLYTTTSSSVLLSSISNIVLIVFFICTFLYAIWRHLRKTITLPDIALLTPFIPLVLVLALHWEIIPAFMAGIAYGTLTTWQHNSINILTRSIIDGITNVIPAVAVMIGIGMLLAAVMHPQISSAMAPLLAHVIPTHAIAYVAVFTLIAPLALYRGPLSLWGMGSGLVGLVKQTSSLTSPAIMAMLMSVGQVQGISDPTNTQNIWVANYLGTDTQVLLRRTIPYAWTAAFLGLCLAVAFGYVAW